MDTEPCPAVMRPCPSFCLAIKWECLELLQLIPWHTTSHRLHPPPSQHHHPPPSSIVHHRVCESSRDPRLIVRVLDNQRPCLPKSLTPLGEDKCLV
ncbi:hypothetical protein Hanom_Chr09g00864811 [Helianthus anomalus]